MRTVSVMYALIIPYIVITLFLVGEKETGTCVLAQGNPASSWGGGRSGMPIRPPPPPPPPRPPGRPRAPHRCRKKRGRRVCT
uniref:Uncharacterized protein n=1 Tax=Rhipicephalus zambeziensis TaxID=60191 RepID=A0A224Y7Z5_9ACAR